MLKLIIAVILMINLGTGWSLAVKREISDEEARMLSNLASMEKPDDSAELGPVEKRYSQSILTGWQSKSMDQSAVRKLLKYFISKRGNRSGVPQKRSGASPIPVVEEIEPQLHSTDPDLSAYVLILGKINNSIVDEVVNDTEVN